MYHVLAGGERDVGRVQLERSTTKYHSEFLLLGLPNLPSARGPYSRSGGRQTCVWWGGVHQRVAVPSIALPGANSLGSSSLHPDLARSGPGILKLQNYRNVNMPIFCRINSPNVKLCGIYSWLHAPLTSAHRGS